MAPIVSYVTRDISCLMEPVNGAQKDISSLIQRLVQVPASKQNVALEHTIMKSEIEIRVKYARLIITWTKPITIKPYVSKRR